MSRLSIKRSKAHAALLVPDTSRYFKKALAQAVSHACIGGLTASLLAGSAFAAQPAAKAGTEQNPQVGEQDDQLDTVVVTAQKRSEKLKDVPIPITAISGEAT